MLEVIRRSLQVIPTAALIALFGTQAAAGNLIVVDQAGSADYLDIQDAVSAAQDGDVILILSGIYAGFTVNDKELHISAVDGADVECRGNVVLQDIALGRSVTVRGLTATPSSAGTTEIAARALWIHDSPGGVRIEGCDFSGRGNFGVHPVGGYIERASNVAIVSCTFDPGFLDRGGDGLVAEDSNLALYRTTCTGGVGYNTIDEGSFADDGGNGVVLSGTPGEFFASDSTFVGGEGGYGDCGYPGNGGDGLHAGSWNPWLLELSAVPGIGGTCYPSGFGTQCCTSDGNSGVGIVGQVTQLTGSARHLDAPAVVQESGPFVVRFEGLPGDEVYLLAGNGTGFERANRYNGTLLLEQPLLAGTRSTSGGTTSFADLPLENSVLYLGTIPAGGVLNAPVMALGLPFGVATQGAQVQGALRDSMGNSWMTDSLRLDVIECASLGVDCNENGIPDSCDISDGVSLDCNGNGMPDECEWDCDLNGVPDDCDIAAGTSLDLNGNSIPDECEGALRLHVDVDALAGGNGHSWGSALNDLQEALNLHRLHPLEVRDIWVAEGVYYPTSGLDVEASFRPGAGAIIYGGFTGTETSLSQRNLELHPTVLSGDLLGNDAFPSGMSDNTAHVVVVDETTPNVLMDGLAIRGGNATNAQISYIAGGGLLLRGASGFLVSRCEIYENKASTGGGMAIYRSAVGAFPVGDVVNCTIRRNRAVGTTFVLTRSGGGVLLNDAGSVRLINCAILDNHAAGYGGAIAEMPINSVGTDNVQILACTIVGNSSANGAGGIHLFEGGPGVTAVQGTIIWNNSGVGSTSNQQIKTSGLNISVRLSCVQGGVWAGTGNINSDPMFVNELARDLRLAAGSACIDSSRNGLLPGEDPSDLDQDGDLLEELPLDLGGNPRRMDDPAAPDTGSGVAPIIDMGAHERDPINP